MLPLATIMIVVAALPDFLQSMALLLCLPAMLPMPALGLVQVSFGIPNALLAPVISIERLCRYGNNEAADDQAGNKQFSFMQHKSPPG